MNSFRPHQSPDDPVRKAEETLRIIANLPAPEGLSDRVQARLRSVPRTSSVLSWRSAPLHGWMFSPALRGAAAAAIVCIVAGGGWQIYSRVQPAATAQNPNVVMPSRVGPNGGFSTGGAIARPDTLNGPVLVPPAPKAENVIVHPRANQIQTPAGGTKRATPKKKTPPPTR